MGAPSERGGCCVTGSHPAPRATARHAFKAVGERLDIQPELLAYLFAECLNEILEETKSTASCTLRGTGKFRSVALKTLVKENQKRESITVFEKTKHITKYKPFAALHLAKRVAKA